MKDTLEKDYMNIVSYDHRKRFGQFYTPEMIADLMAAWIMQSNPKNICDPAFGLGSFYKSCKKMGFNGIFFANEIDKVSYEFVKKNINIGTENLYISNTDYFLNWDNKYDAIICNPPYLRFQFFYTRETVIQKLKEITGENFSGYTNIASAFLVKSILELQENGRLAYIMPCEFLNTGYGVTVKKILLSYGVVHNIIKVNDEFGVFSEVTTTICIILFEKVKKNNNRYITFSKIMSISSMKILEIRKTSSTSINYRDKWLPYFSYHIESTELPSSFVPLSTYGHFKRGIATGANDFFVLRRSQIVKIGLTDSEYKLCITKSNQISNLFFTQEDIDDLEKNDAPIYIFSPIYDTNSQNLFGQCLSQQAQEYIRYGEVNQYNCRYLTRTRKVWFFLERRDPAPILFGVFSRGNFKIIRNETSSINLTCYHGFTPNHIGSKYIDRMFIFLNSTLGNYCLTSNKRQYGNDLDKFEPSDLDAVKVPSPGQLERIPDWLIQQEMEHLRKFNSLSEGGEIHLNDFFHL